MWKWNKTILVEFNNKACRRATQLPATVDKSRTAEAMYKDGIPKLPLSKREDTSENHKKVIEVLL